MATPPSYTIVRLPRSHYHVPTWQALVAKYKALRLQALLTSPEAYGSTYEREIAFTDAEWEARLKNPAAHSLIAVRSSAPLTAHQADDALDSEWVGSAVLVGPRQDYMPLLATFDINALFVVPEARGTGLGAELIEGAVSEAQLLARGAIKVVVRALVVRDNERVLKLYERAGFDNQGVEFVGGKLKEAWVLAREWGG